MNKSAYTLSIYILFLSIVSCGTVKKIEALKPIPSESVSMVYKNKTSFIAMPVEITIQDIQKQLNKSLKGLIFEDDNIEDDNVKMKIWKTDNIQLKEKNGIIYSQIPLKILITVKYGSDFLGLNDTKDIYLNGTVSLKSKTHLTNWKLTTNSTIEKLEWNESPSIIVSGKQIPITYLINPAISMFKKDISKEIDNAIDATCDFKPSVLDALEVLSKPFLVNDAYKTWFKLQPIELYDTAAILKDNKITMQMGLKCIMQTMVGQEPQNNFKKDNIVLKPVTSMPDKINASIAAVSTFKNASEIITKNFKGVSFTSGNRSVTVQKVDIWQKENKLIIALDLIGSVNGTIYLSGYPNYNSISKEIYFDELDYVLNTKSILLKSANWLAQNTILKKIKENCRYSIQDNLDEAKQSMLPYLNNYSPTKGIFVNGTLNDFEFEKIELINDAIIAFISTSGKMKVTIDGME
ncbi:MAG: DUF4403 family protein [Flavobacterium sp.]|jgi:hypothetical protein